MDQLITFTSNNTILVISIIIVSFMLLNNIFGEKLRGYTSITPVESTQMINQDDALVLDVRLEQIGTEHLVLAKELVVRL